MGQIVGYIPPKQAEKPVEVVIPQTKEEQPKAKKKKEKSELNEV